MDKAREEALFLAGIGHPDTVQTAEVIRDVLPKSSYINDERQYACADNLSPLRCSTCDPVGGSYRGIHCGWPENRPLLKPIW